MGSGHQWLWRTRMAACKWDLDARRVDVRWNASHGVLVGPGDEDQGGSSSALHQAWWPVLKR